MTICLVLEKLRKSLSARILFLMGMILAMFRVLNVEASAFGKASLFLGHSDQLDWWNCSFQCQVIFLVVARWWKARIRRRVHQCKTTYCPSGVPKKFAVFLSWWCYVFGVKRGTIQYAVHAVSLESCISCASIDYRRFLKKVTGSSDQLKVYLTVGWPYNVLHF